MNMSIKEEYLYFLQNCTNAPKSYKNYSDFRRICDILSKIYKTEDFDIYQITNEEQFNEIIKALESNDTFKDYNKTGNNQYSNALAQYHKFIKARTFFKSISDDSFSKTYNKTDNLSYQQIFYGAPGTGKSHRIKELLEEGNVPRENIFRTTFHPDSDYSSFVGAYKPTMKKRYRYEGQLKAKYHEDDDLTGAKQNDFIIDRVIEYDFIPQAFIRAYIRAYRIHENVYLVIEEINRGNCAQIFGDLFQLLDRNDSGVSDYSIKADADLRRYLEDELGKDNEGIRDGELRLPSNLYIWATMNTSDQSLFPIDSAFKRRWDWKYEPIKYKNTDWTIEIDDTQYSWTSFQRIVNTKIYDDNHSEDKMLGDFFVKPYHGYVITCDQFLNKVLFYLWNDVCKESDVDIFKANENDDILFSELHGERGISLLHSMMVHLGVEVIRGNEE